MRKQLARIWSGIPDLLAIPLLGLAFAGAFTCLAILWVFSLFVWAVENVTKTSNEP